MSVQHPDGGPCAVAPDPHYQGHSMGGPHRDPLLDQILWNTNPRGHHSPVIFCRGQNSNGALGQSMGTLRQSMGTLDQSTGI